jgi:hypothetical protein
MTTILLIVFGIVFYQLLIKVALQPSLTQNQYQQPKKQGQDFMRMWRELQDFQQKQQRTQNSKTEASSPKKEKPAAQFLKGKGYQGGEYIDYEEL